MSGYLDFVNSSALAPEPKFQAIILGPWNLQFSWLFGESHPDSVLTHAHPTKPRGQAWQSRTSSCVIGAWVMFISLSLSLSLCCMSVTKTWYTNWPYLKCVSTETQSPIVLPGTIHKGLVLSPHSLLQPSPFSNLGWWHLNPSSICVIQRIPILSLSRLTFSFPEHASGAYILNVATLSPALFLVWATMSSHLDCHGYQLTDSSPHTYSSLWFLRKGHLC